MDWWGLYNKIKIIVVVILFIILFYTFYYVTYDSQDNPILIKHYPNCSIELCVEIPSSPFLPSTLNLSTLRTTGDSSESHKLNLATD
jgi:hypothetical protein